MEILFVGSSSVLGNGCTTVLDGLALTLKVSVHSFQGCFFLMLCGPLVYFSVFYMGLPMKMSRKLQPVQNASTRILPCTDRFPNETPHLHWFPVVLHAQSKVLVITCKAFCGLGQNDHITYFCLAFAIIL